MPKISVVMPVFNTAEAYLRESIQSILAQTFSDFEFIIINDGSTNNAEEIIGSFSDHRIRYIKNPVNYGLSRTLNIGIAAARGEYIARMDSDDIALSERFEKQFRYLEQHPEIGVLGAWYKEIPGNRIICPPVDDRSIKSILLFKSSAFGHPTVIMRSSLLAAYRLEYREDNLYAEDYGLWLEMLDKTTFGNIDEPLLYYRQHKENISIIHAKTQLRMANRLRLNAQKQILNITVDEILTPLNKILLQQPITSAEFECLINYFYTLIKNIPASKHQDVPVNEIIYYYRSMSTRCIRDLKFLALLWQNPLNQFIKYGLLFRCSMSLIGWF